MSEKKPMPIVPQKVRAVCPVCGLPAYSRAGLHPQCAATRVSRELHAAARASAAVNVNVNDKKSWTKACPKCGIQLPARRSSCDCGFRFQSSVANF